MKTHLGCLYSSGWAGIIRSIKVEIADVLSGASYILIMSSPEDRERKLNRLGRLFRRDLDVEIRHERPI
jgi:hypothetical protein